MDYSERRDLYEYKKPEKEERTRERLKEMVAMGLEEVGVADFGIKGKTSGLYIENVWSFSDEYWKEYIDWLKTFKNK